VAIPEQALLNGAFLMYLLPLLAMFVGAGLSRWLGWPDLVQTLTGGIGLFVGFYWVANSLKKQNAVIAMKMKEEEI
jgi:sigma-E factor negative regulatory protein RseC